MKKKSTQLMEKVHPFLSDLLKEAQPIIGHLMDELQKRKVIRLQTGPSLNDFEAYHCNSFFYASSLNSLPAQINFISHLFETSKPKRKRNSKFIRADYIEFYFSSYIGLLTTAFDLALGLVNEILCLGIEYNKVNAQEVMENPRAKKLDVLEPLKTFQRLSGKYPGQRNAILHRGNRPFIKPLDPLILVERTMNLMELAKKPFLSRIDLNYEYEQLIPKITSEIKKSILEIESATTKLFNVLIPINRDFSKKFYCLKTKNVEAPGIEPGSENAR